MFFFLSKTISFLIRPLTIILASLILSWGLRNPKWKKRMFYFGMGLLLLFSNDFLSNELMKAWEVEVTPFASITRKYEYGIILSGVAKAEVGPADRIYLASGADRITHTLQLYRMGYIRKILISGGSGRLFGDGEREADELSSLLKLMGVPQEDILIENNSRNTHESAVAVKQMLSDKTTPDQCLLITSSYHMRRSLGCFKKSGWPTDGFSVDFLSHNRQFYFDVLFIPKLEAIFNWNVLFKEWAGYTMYWMMGYV
jgi:uncharacterized SAM-binding protein YcdF (DUF218 family)